MLQVTNKSGIISCAKDKFRSTVISRANIADIWFPLYENLCATKVAQLENPSGWIQKEILRFDISMTYSHRMNVREGPQALVHVEFDFEHWHLLFHFRVGSRATVEVFGDVFQNQVQVNFTLLQKMSAFKKTERKGI